MQKLLRKALPWAVLTLMVSLVFADCLDALLYIVCALLVAGVVSIAILYVKLWKFNRCHCQLKKQAEEVVAPELEHVKGNSLKKQMVKRKLIREYVEEHSKNDVIAIKNIKDWLSSLKWSVAIICFPGIPIMLLLAFILAFGFDTQSRVPAKIDYHSADDLRKVTGVEFPDIVPVDSFYSDGGLAAYNTQVKFVPLKPLDKEFFHRLDRACKTDSCCWKKELDGYHYYILPDSMPLDRTKGMHWRMVEVDGKKVPDWDGTYISVFVPIKGDTITLNDGWTR